MAISQQFLLASLLLACSVLGSPPAPPGAEPAVGFERGKARWPGGQPTDGSGHGAAAAVVKRLPVEDKSSKKSTAPPLDAARCQEVSARGGAGRCLRCKEPSSGATYEHCTYSSARPKARGPRSSDSGLAASQPAGYRFGDDFFQTESAEPGAGGELEPSSSDDCRRERRDSMLCMVCKDPKTNGKYEQCSYVGGRQSQPPSQPQPRARAHQHREPRGKEHKAERRKHRRRDEAERLGAGSSEEAADDQGSRNTYLGYPSFIGGQSSGGGGGGGGGDGDGDDDGEAAADEAPRNEKLRSADKGCRSVKRDGESCTVCTDPDTGAKSEKCNYSFEPKDKAYAYSKSQSFGYPDGGGKSHKRPQPQRQRHDDHLDEEDSADEEGYHAEAESRAESAEDYGASYASPDYIRSESERISKTLADKGECREERRDGMLCRVCKEPHSGDDFEQCNYSYEPDDKVYAYSKSKHFGSASPGSGESEEPAGQPEESAHASSVLDYLPKPGGRFPSFATPSPTLAAAPGEAPPARQLDSGSRVDSGFDGATKRRAEIERITRAMGARDRSGCSRSLRRGMTCYSCKDDKGFSNEECVFVTEPEGSGGAAPTTAAPAAPAAAAAAAGRRRRRSHEAGRQEERERQPPADEELAEAEAYDYVAETRPVYDAVLGLTLPAYMVNPSKQELDFDRSAENAKP